MEVGGSSGTKLSYSEDVKKYSYRNNSLVQKYHYRNAFKSVELSTRLNKSRGGNFVIICKFVRSVATETDLKKEKIIRIEFF
jgi:hypothetical protein